MESDVPAVEPVQSVPETSTEIPPNVEPVDETVQQEGIEEVHENIEEPLQEETVENKEPEEPASIDTPAPETVEIVDQEVFDFLPQVIPEADPEQPVIQLSDHISRPPSPKTGKDSFK